jgi:hypothetical protein
MSAWAPLKRAAFEREYAAGRAAFAVRELDAAFRHFERAHVIGQRRTLAHVRAHLAMLRVGWARRDWREIVGQLLRIPAAATKSRLWVPTGNTGGADVSALAPMPVAEDLREYLE